MINWNDSYATGNDAIDRQHKLLFDFFNHFEIAINEGKGKEYMEKSFHFLESYAKAHFRFEENCMHEHHCAVAGKNKLAHQTFAVTIEAYVKKFQSKQYDEYFFVEIHTFLNQWVKSHIIGIDVHLKDCMNH